MSHIGILFEKKVWVRSQWEINEQKIFWKEENLGNSLKSHLLIKWENNENPMRKLNISHANRLKQLFRK